MSPSPASDVVTPPGSHLAPPFDLPALRRWLMPALPVLATGELTAERLPAGQSNPTWRLRHRDGTWVLRAKPGPASGLLPSAHAIEREVAVLRALQGSGVPVPAVHALCEDESVIGAAFYVMDFVDGRIVRDATLPQVGAEERRAMHDDAVRVLAALHAVDWRARGLAGFGRHDAFFERMIARWTRQYTATASAPIDAMERLAAWLPAHCPPPPPPGQDLCIVHGDFRLENLVFHAQAPRVLAVLDWELSTLGHPLADLAYHCMAWRLPQGVLRGLAGVDLGALGIPSEAEIITRYAALAGHADVDAIQAHWPFYLACNLFRLAAILQGIAYRAGQGIASHPQAMDTGRMAAPVAELGWRIAQGRAG
ncbi:phosphotransferase family protein [Rubrivivax albus]|uniref:Phosphotransferase family protein n=1 Tax=Rubrivivax albus TaxID=2499835 RepID=A0A3S2TQD6_9BURK|nr:phosphotransferase family protein [Rubrivivax albus]RVT50941.1 phosphotransferase family protein [Rubrivivax albus]